MSDQSTPDGGPPEATEGTQTEQTSEQAAPEWLGPIQERMNELGEQTGRMAEQFSSFFEQQQAEPEPELDFYDDEGDLTPEGAQALIDQRVDERLQQTLSQRDAARALDEREDAFEALREDIPALQDDALAAQLVRDTAAWCRENNLTQMVETPAFVDLVEHFYKSGQFDERVSAERSTDTEREVVLESATGASAPASKEPDWGQRIVDAASKLRPQI